MSENDRILVDLKTSTVPFTYRFLGLRLKLAFTKRRFERAEASYHEHLTSDHAGLNGLTDILEDSFSMLRDEISRIEEGQACMKKRALPKVQEQLMLHQSFLCFLSGFRSKRIEGDDGKDVVEKDVIEEYENSDKETSNKRCNLPMLNRDDETTTAIKKCIAEFAGVPTGMLVHDLRSLETLLEQSEHETNPYFDPVLMALETPPDPADASGAAGAPNRIDENAPAT